MANRYWTSNPQRSVEARGHGPAYSRDGGKVLNDTETQPPYNANIGPDGPDLNRVGFPTVKAFVKARFMIMEGGSPLIGPLMENGQFLSGTGGQAGGGGEMIGKIGEALGKAGSAVGSSSQDKGSEGKMYEPGHNGGSAPVETRFSGHVRRRGEG